MYTIFQDVVGEMFVIVSCLPVNGSRPVTSWKDRRHQDDVPESNQGCQRSRWVLIYRCNETNSKTNAEDKVPAGRLLATLQRSFRGSTSSRVDFFGPYFCTFSRKRQVVPPQLAPSPSPVQSRETIPERPSMRYFCGMTHFFFFCFFFIRCKNYNVRVRIYPATYTSYMYI